MTVLAWLACALALLPLGLIIINLFCLKRLPRGRSAKLVSVLIPARDEAKNIAAAIESVLASDHRHLELIVLDDDSSDGTGAIVRHWSQRDRRVRLIHGKPHDPALWGKPQACAALADAARGEILLFMDADVRLERDAVGTLAAHLARSRSALISGIPRQLTGSLAERLVVPLIHFVLLGFLPLAAMRMSPRPEFGVACGQLLAVRKDAYFDAGGHRRIADRIHDGMALARSLRRFGHMTDLADFSDLASCRMYRSAREVLDGFAKNAHEGLGSRRGIVPWTLLLLGGQSAWLVLLPAALAGSDTWLPLMIAALAALAARLLLDLRFLNPALGFVLHPLGVLALVAIQWYALIRRAAGCPVAWKKRLPSAAPAAPAARIGETNRSGAQSQF